MSSCDKVEVDEREFEKGEPGFFKYTGTFKCKHCGRKFHAPTTGVIKAVSVGMAASWLASYGIHISN